LELKPSFFKIVEVLRLFPNSMPHASDIMKQLEDAVTELGKGNIALRTR
jgi:hypothetical protein